MSQITVPPLRLGAGAFPDLSAGVGNPLEKLVRPFETLTPRWPPPVAPGKNAAEEKPPAFLAWGDGGDFDQTSPDMPIEDMAADGYTNQSFPDVPRSEASTGRQQRKPKAPQDNKPGTFEYNEMDRCVQRMRIWNPDDNTQWLDVERVTTIRFRGPRGEVIKFNLRPPPSDGKPISSAPETGL